MAILHYGGFVVTLKLLRVLSDLSWRLLGPNPAYNPIKALENSS